MEKFAYRIENLLLQKLDCYTRLVDVLKQDSKAIIAMDTHALWASVSAKKEIGAAIEDHRSSILHVFDEMHIPHAMDSMTFRLSQAMDLLSIPPRIRYRLETVIQEINLKKDEVQSLAAENQRSVNDYLGIFSGIIGTIVKSPRKHQYTSSGTLRDAGRSTYMIQAEV